MKKKPLPWFSLDNRKVLPSLNCLIIEMNCNSTPDRGGGRWTVLGVRKRAGADRGPANAWGCSYKTHTLFLRQPPLIGSLIAGLICEYSKGPMVLACFKTSQNMLWWPPRHCNSHAPTTFLFSDPRHFFFCLPTCSPGCRQNEFQVTYVGVDFFRNKQQIMRGKKRLFSLFFFFFFLEGVHLFIFSETLSGSDSRSQFHESVFSPKF